MRLASKVVVITGAGNGQGKAAASLFAQEGAHVVVTDVDGEALFVCMAPDHDEHARKRARQGRIVALELT